MKNNLHSFCSHFNALAEFHNDLINGYCYRYEQTLIFITCHNNDHFGSELEETRESSTLLTLH